MLTSRDALRAIAQARTDQVVLTTMTAVFEWDDVAPDDPMHLPIIGSMGKASSFALGIALGRPDIGVICIDGDGSLAMNLGSLLSIATNRPENLSLIVMQNDAYNMTGGQPIPGAGIADFAGLARAAGFASSAAVADAESLSLALPGVLAGPRPSFLAVKVAKAGPPPPPHYGRTKRAMAAIAEQLRRR